MVLSGKEICALMRKHRMTMRQLKAKYGITLKRIREVRESGLAGFFAEEWVFLITGKWPTQQ